MTTHVRQFATIFGLSALLGTAALVAQSSRAVATIPFGFHVKDTALPAGKYSVDTENNGVLTVRNAQNGHAIIVMTRGRNSSGSKDPRLTFKRYGSDYYLSEVRLPGASAGLGIARTAKEKELAKGPAITADLNIRLAGE